MKTRILAICVALGIGTGCRSPHTLHPARGAQIALDRADAAIDRVADVQVRVDGTRGHQLPGQLVAPVTPLFVHIDNHADHPIRLRYEDMILRVRGGLPRRALPPFPASLGPPQRASRRVSRERRPTEPAGGMFRLRGRRAPRIRHGFVHERFYVAPHIAHHFHDLDPWTGPFSHANRYYHAYHAGWEADPPNDVVLERALPEGVARSGGRVAGFVYFQRFRESGRRVAFRMAVVDARTERVLGIVHIPLVVR